MLMLDLNLQEIVERVLRARLGSVGLDRVEVTSGVDHDGADALFIDAVLRPGSPLVNGETSSEALRDVSDALLDAGETRFPYLWIRHPDDERPEDDDDRRVPLHEHR